jgi:signal transduction histidine kinase
MLNLVRNAHEHTPLDADVGIGSDWADGTVRFWVRDRGRGVAPGDRERIFERFARGGSGRGRSEGAGLGLAIVRSIAEAHGGSVSVSSPPGEGATFTIVLPVRPQSSVPRGTLELPPPVHGQRRADPIPRSEVMT